MGKKRREEEREAKVRTEAKARARMTPQRVALGHLFQYYQAHIKTEGQIGKQIGKLRKAKNEKAIDVCNLNLSLLRCTKMMTHAVLRRCGLIVPE